MDNDEDEDNMIDDEEEDFELIEDEENELHYSVEGLGQFHEIEGQKLFVKTDDCVHCIHDIQLALRKEDGRKVDKFLGIWQTFEKRLVPLFLHYREDSKIWTGVLKLLVILTRPILKGSTTETTLHIKFLQDYKEALNTQDVFITLMSILMDAVSNNEQTDIQIRDLEAQIDRIDVAPPVSDETQAPPEEHKKIMKREKESKRTEIRYLSEKSKIHEKNVELVLTLIRHLLEIPDPKPGDSGYTQSRGCLQVQLIKYLSDEEILGLLIMFAEQIDLPKYKHLNWLFFEIFYHVCATIPPSELANYDAILKVDLSRLLEIEKKLVYAQVPQYSRHSRFANNSVLKHVTPSGGSAESISEISSIGKAARNRFYREKKSTEAPSLFMDPSFIDINIVNDSAALPSSILGKDYRAFYADIKAFVDQFLTHVFPHLMKSVYEEVSSEKNLQEFDTVRVLNMITWILDYQVKLVRKSKEFTCGWAVEQDALNLVTVQLKLHSKEAKTIRSGGANLVVALRALLEQLRMARVAGVNSGISFIIADSFAYDEIYRNLTWTVRNYRPTAHRPEVLGYAVQCIDEYLRLTEMHLKKIMASEKGAKKIVSRSKKNELKGQEFYDQGHSDSDAASIRTGSSEEEDLNFKDSLERGKDTIMADICHGEAIRNFFHLLSIFKKNSTSVNDGLCALILRIIRENESYVAFFFQLSYLIIIYNIINDSSLRAVEEERRKYDSVILISKLIIKRFINVAKTNKLLFVEILFPRLKSGRSGHLLSLESDLASICCNYSDDESRMILERIHQGDTYDDLKAERLERSKYAQPWTDDEDQQLIGLWEHVKSMEGKSNRDRVNMVVANTVPLEGKKKRRFKDVKLRLVALGLLVPTADDEQDEYSDYYSSDGEFRGHRDNDSSPGSRSSRSEVSEDETNPTNFQEYVNRVNAVKVSDKLTAIFTDIIALNTGLTDDERLLLGPDIALKFFGA